MAPGNRCAGEAGLPARQAGGAREELAAGRRAVAA